MQLLALILKALWAGLQIISSYLSLLYINFEASFFRGSHFVSTSAIVGEDMNINYRKISIATLYLQNGAKFIAWCDDMFDMIQGRPIPSAGVSLKVLEYTTGLKPFVWGKPNPLAFELVRNNFGEFTIDCFSIYKT